MSGALASYVLSMNEQDDSDNQLEQWVFLKHRTTSSYWALKSVLEYCWPLAQPGELSLVCHNAKAKTSLNRRKVVLHSCHREARGRWGSGQQGIPPLLSLPPKQPKDE